MIRTLNLTRRFGEFTAVDKLNLEVEEGEIFGFLGPNGAGKTTTIRMLCGLVAPTSGEAWVGGFKLGSETENQKARNVVGLLTESPGLYELLNAWDNLLFYARLYQLPKIEARKRVEEILRWLDLWERRDEPVGGYSKGMKQKLAIGRALLHRPMVLFFDEPTASLDAEAAKTVRDAIITLKNTRRTIFLSTHNLDEAEKLCDRIAIFKQKLLVVDTPRHLKREPGRDLRRVRVRLAAPLPPGQLETLSKLPFVGSLEKLAGEESGLEVSVNRPEENNPLLIKALVEAGAAIQFVEEQTASLEDIYLKLIH